MRGGGAIALAVAVMLIGAASAAPASVAADPPAECTSGIYDDFGSCVIGVGTGDDDSTGNEGSTPIEAPESGDEQGGNRDNKCNYFGAEIHCNSPAGVWNGNCYVEAVEPQPDEGERAGEGHEAGVIVSCTSNLCVDQPNRDHDPTCPDRYLLWMAALPGVGGAFGGGAG